METPNITVNLSELCAKKGVSKYRLAKDIGVSSSALTLIARGERQPSTKMVAAICARLNCKVSDLLTLNKTPENISASPLT